MTVKMAIKRSIRPAYLKTAATLRSSLVKRGRLPGPKNLLIDPQAVSFSYVSRVEPSVDRETETVIGSHFFQEWNHWDIGDEVLIAEEDVPIIVSQIREIRRQARSANIEVSIDPALDSSTGRQAAIRGRFDLNLPCKVVWDSLLVGPHGHLSVCPMLTHLPVANVRETSLSEFWRSNEELLKVRRIVASKASLPICANCCAHTAMMT